MSHRLTKAGHESKVFKHAATIEKRAWRKESAMRCVFFFVLLFCLPFGALFAQVQVGDACNVGRERGLIMNKTPLTKQFCWLRL
ncbi:MAG: hypothetical protein ACRDH2_13805 [Anaerolineales bacterium]